MFSKNRISCNVWVFRLKKHILNTSALNLRGTYVTLKKKNDLDLL